MRADNRLVLDYEIEDGEVPRTVALPFAIGVMAGLSGHSRDPLPPLADREFLAVTRASIDHLIRTIGPRVFLRLPGRQAPSILDDLEVNFRTLEDFDDDHVRRQVAALQAFENPVEEAAAVSLVLQHPVFLELRGAWSGLASLCDVAARFTDVEVWALDLTKIELAKTLKQYRGSAWDQSPVFKKLFDERLAAHGGVPFGCLVGDFDFSHTADDLATLESMAMVAEATHCSFLTGISPRTLHLRRWEDLRPDADIELLFNVPEYAGWRTWRAQPASQYVSLCPGTVGVDSAIGRGTAVRRVFGIAAAVMGAFGCEGSWRSLDDMLAEADTDQLHRPGASDPLWRQLVAVDAAPNGLADLLLRSRFQHYARAMVRDTFGGIPDAGHIRRYLWDSLMQYVDGSPEHSSDATALLKPLVAVEVEVFVAGLVAVPHVRLRLRNDPEPAQVRPTPWWRLKTRISYVAEMYGAECVVEPPFVLGVIGDFSGAGTDRLTPPEERRFLEVDCENLDRRLAAAAPSVAFHVRDAQGHPIAITLTFASLYDLSPRGIAEQIPETKGWLDTRDSLVALNTYARWCDGGGQIVDRLLTSVGTNLADLPSDAASTAAHEFDVLTDEARSTIAAALGRMADLVRSGDINWPGQVATAIAQAMRVQDERLSTVVNAVMHHPDVQKLERTWLGLRHLVDDDTVENVRVRMIDVSEREFRETLLANQNGPLTDHWLFRIVKAERTQPLGEPLGCLIADYAFDENDVNILSELGRIGEAMSCPVVGNVKPTIMGMDSWLELGVPRTLTKIFTTPGYAAWRGLREDACSRFVVLAMPRFLGRAPVEADDASSGFSFVETCSGHEDFVWINAAFAVGRVLRRAFTTFGWPGHIAGVQTGGTLSDLTPGLKQARIAKFPSRVPTEVAIGDRRLRELVEMGFAPLVGRQNDNRATFFHLPSLLAVSPQPGAEPQGDMFRFVRLEYVLAECLFLQRIAGLIRDKVGSFGTAGALRDVIQSWITDYVDSDTFSSSSLVQAQKPLASAEVVVVRRASDDVATHLSLWVRPSYQMTPLSVAMPQLIELPPDLRRARTEVTDAAASN